MLASQRNTPCHYEADHYFIDDDGVYRFKPEDIKAAHEWCQQQTEAGLVAGLDVVVSNTFTQNWEMDPYLQMAKDLNIPVQVIECKGRFKSIHNVPPESLKRMARRWEEYKPLWP